MLKLFKGKQPKTVHNYFVSRYGSKDGHYITADTVKKNGKVVEFILNGETVAYYSGLSSFNIVE